RRHAVQDVGIVVDAKNRDLSEPATVNARIRLARLSQHRRRNRNLDRKMCTAIDLRSKRNRMTEHAGNAFHDREAEPETAGDLGAPIEAMKLGEYGSALVRRNADARIVNIDAQPLATTPATDQDATGSGIFDGVGNEILQQAAQYPAVGQ